MKLIIYTLGLAAALFCLELKGSADETVGGRQEEFSKMPLPAELGEIPHLKCPLYVWEYHIWYRSPFGADPREGYDHGGDSQVADSESEGVDWQRSRRHVGYSLLGTYGSNEPDVIRWQLRCMKAAGIDGVFVQLFSEWSKGDFFIGEQIFSNLLDIAAEEGMKVGIHDEIQFRKKSPAQDPEVMIKRWSDFLKKYAKHSAYLRINGKPVVTFAYWDYLEGKVLPAEMKKIFQKVDESIGEPVFWMPAHGAGAESELLAMPELGGMVVKANNNEQFRYILSDAEKVKEANSRQVISGYVDEPLPQPISDKDMKTIHQAMENYPSKLIGLWGYPGFDNSTGKGRRERIDWLPRRGGKTLVEVLRYYSTQNPSFIILTSWNDWEENTALEPGIDYDGYQGDPYLYCRILAAAKGKTFTPPLLPPKEAIDPWMWQPLFGIDKTPPQIVSSRYSPLEPAIVATVADSAHPVSGAQMLEHGDAWVSIDEEGSISKEGVVSISSTKMVPLDGGLVLPSGETITVNFAPTSLANDGKPIYIGIEFSDMTKGRITVSYPTETPVLDYKPMDEHHKRFDATISSEGAGQWTATIRRIRGIKLDGKPIPIQISFNADSDENIQPLRIGRLHLFQQMVDAKAGVELSFANALSQCKTYRFPCPNLEGQIPRAVYLIGTDSEGNKSAPVAILSSGIVQRK